MKHSFPLLLTIGVLLGLAAPAARADSAWYYQTTATNSSGTSNIVWSTHPSPSQPWGGIELLAPSYGSAVGNREIVMTNLRAFSCAPSHAPERFENAGYHLSLTILDVASNASGTVSFSGLFNGSLSHVIADIRNTFGGEMTKAIQLGDNLYTVTLGNYAPPGPPSSGLLGGITAFVTVAPMHTPEPSTLLLASVGGAFLGLNAWRKRMRNR